MYYVVVLIGDLTNLCIPASWVFIIDAIAAQNYGLNCNKKKRIFFSKNFEKTPNFLLPLRHVFDPNDDACYLANIKKTFRTMDECSEYMKKRGTGLPPIYNENRNRKKTPSVIEGATEIDLEIERKRDIKMEIKTELDKVLFPLRNALSKFNKMLPIVYDLTEDDSNSNIDLTIKHDLKINKEPCDISTFDEGAFSGSGTSLQELGAEIRAHGEGTLAQALSIQNQPQSGGDTANSREANSFQTVNECQTHDEDTPMEELGAEIRAHGEGKSAQAQSIRSQPHSGDTAILRETNSFLPVNECQTRKEGATVTFDPQLLLQIKRELKAEIEKRVTPLRDAVILLNSSLPACDLTDGDIETVDVSDDENSEQPVPHDIAADDSGNAILDDISGSLQSNLVQANHGEGNSTRALSIQSRDHGGDTTISRGTNSFPPLNGTQPREEGGAVTYDPQLLLRVKKEIKAEMDDKVTALQEAVILLSSLLPSCDLTVGEIGTVDVSEDENSEPPVPNDYPAGSCGNAIHDDFSGSLEFNLIQESGARFYLDGNVSISALSLMLLTKYNTTKNESIYDQRFVYFLLSSVLSEEEKTKKKISQAKLSFVRKIYLHRIAKSADATDRAVKFDEYIKLQVQDISEKNKKLKKN